MTPNKIQLKENYTKIVNDEMLNRNRQATNVQIKFHNSIIIANSCQCLHSLHPYDIIVNGTALQLSTEYTHSQTMLYNMLQVGLYIRMRCHNCCYAMNN